MLDHFFISDCDGALHDTRVANWSSPPLRANYQRHHTTIETVADFKATLRAGPYAWPGGYPLYFITSDGAALSFTAARDEYRLIVLSSQEKAGDGWQIVACDVNYEDSDLVCDHTGQPIESAYS